MLNELLEEREKRLAQLGARVLEILRRPEFWSERANVSSASALASFEEAAHSLGLLGEGEVKP